MRKICNTPCFLFLLLICSCQSKTPENEVGLKFVELRRGENSLCGNEQSGEVNFALSNERALLQSNYQELLQAGESYLARQVLIQIQTVTAWLLYTEGKKEEAVALMAESAPMEYTTAKHPVTPGEVLPVAELLGDLLLELNQPQEALKAYEYNLRTP